VLGAGVIGSVYAGRLLQAGHEVVLMARGARLADLHAHGLILQDAESGGRTALPVVRSVSSLPTIGLTWCWCPCGLSNSPARSLP
jgi:2-dehydropantoate 2-reductase